MQFTSPLSISFDTPVSEVQKPVTSDPYMDKVKETFDVKVTMLLCE